MTEFNANEELMKRLKQRAEFGAEKYGKPLGTWDGRNTIIDCLEEVLDLAVYLTKLNEERKEVADLLSDAADEIDQYAYGRKLPEELRSIAAKLRADILRVGDENYVPAMARLEQMSGT